MTQTSAVLSVSYGGYFWLLNYPMKKKFSAAWFFVLVSLLSPRATLLAECQMMTASSSGIKSQIKKCMHFKSTNNNKKNNNI